MWIGHVLEQDSAFRRTELVLFHSQVLWYVCTLVELS